MLVAMRCMSTNGTISLLIVGFPFLVSQFPQRRHVIIRERQDMREQHRISLRELEQLARGLAQFMGVVGHSTASCSARRRMRSPIHLMTGTAMLLPSARYRGPSAAGL